MKKKMREAKMRPVKAWAIVKIKNGELVDFDYTSKAAYQNLMWWNQVKGEHHVVPILISEIPRKKKV